MGKILVGTDLGSYTFDASVSQIEISGIIGLKKEQLLIITNVTSNTIIYDFSEPSLGCSFGSNILTLNFDTSGMSDTDKLQIWVWVEETQTADSLKITDGIRTVDITEANELKVYVAPPSSPPGKTSFNKLMPSNPTQSEVVNGNQTVWDRYIIPNGQTLILQNFFCNAEGPNNDSLFGLYYNPLGKNPATTLDATFVLITPHIFSGIASADISLNETFTGNGIREIVVRRQRLSNGNRRMSYKLTAYY